MTGDDPGAVYYPEYLELEKLLHCQHPRSALTGTPAHDEMLFIVVHQAYELWFKQILFELDLVREIFERGPIIDDSPDLSVVVHRLERVGRILGLLIEQVGVLETMTPLDFLEFRNLLVPASGFQSLQFRLVEAKLGLKPVERHGEAYYRGGFRKEDLEALARAEGEPTLKEHVAAWLERMPFLTPAYWPGAGGDPAPDGDRRHPFWTDYERAYRESLAANEEGGRATFEDVFFAKGEGGFNARAMRAALFITLYRDLPVFRQPYSLLNSLIEIDALLADWRYRHLLMVRRMIGLRTGTGGTSGARYLEGTLGRHLVVPELTGLCTFLIERSRLPKLPRTLTDHLGFRG